MSSTKSSKTSKKVSSKSSAVAEKVVEVEVQPDVAVEETKPKAKKTNTAVEQVEKKKKRTKVVEQEKTEDSQEKVDGKPLIVKGEIKVLDKVKKRAKKADSDSESKTKKASKSPRKTAAKSPKKTTSKSPKKTASKSPKKTTTKKKTKKAVKGDKPKKQKRSHNLREAPIDYTGIGIGPARAKRVLTSVALNPVEEQVRAEILKAENKPVLPKPTKENPEPVMPPQGHQTPLERLSPNTLSVIRKAEKAHHDALVADYERFVVSEMKKADAAEHKRYTDLKSEASKLPNYNLHDFNVSFNAKFYDGLEKYCFDNDSYRLGRVFEKVDKETKEKTENVKYNPWTRAIALVNKQCTRLSSDTRYILAAFLDNIVIQYAKNGIYNCVKEDRSIVQLRHALMANDSDFSNRVPLDPFVRTLNNYQYALDWIDMCKETREEAKKMKEKDRDHIYQVTLPPYPVPAYIEDFDGYVIDICRSVRIHMANAETIVADKNRYIEVSLSSHFKQFCSFIVYESILRIGEILRQTVNFNEVKTVNGSLMYLAIKLLHATCGINSDNLIKDIEKRIVQHQKWREERKAIRKDNKKKKAESSKKLDEDSSDSEDEEPEFDNDGEVVDNDEAAAEENDSESEEEEEAEEAEEKPKAKSKSKAKAKPAEEESDSEEEDQVTYEKE